MLLVTLGTVAGAYALLVGGMAAMQRDMIYHPEGGAAVPVQAGLDEMRVVELRTSDGLTISGWYAPPPSRDRPTVVLFHGNRGRIYNRAVKARALLNAGFGLFLAEYRGYGGNPGLPSEQGLYADARAVIAWLHGRGLPESRLALYGESLGTGVAVQMACEHEVAALVLEAPFTRLPDLAPAIVPAPLAALLMADRYDNRTKIGGVRAPLLVLHGERDTVVPVAMGRTVLDAAPGVMEGVFLPEAGHNDLWDHGAGDDVIRFIARWAS